MNRAILIVICDFLVSAMLSMMTGMVPAHVGGSGVGLDGRTTALLLSELQNRRQQLEAARTKLREAQQKEGFSEAREQMLEKLAGELADTLLKKRTTRRTAPAHPGQYRFAHAGAASTTARPRDPQPPPQPHPAGGGAERTGRPPEKLRLRLRESCPAERGLRRRQTEDLRYRRTARRGAAKSGGTAAAARKQPAPTSRRHGRPFPPARLRWPVCASRSRKLCPGWGRFPVRRRRPRATWPTPAAG
ncbi:MAG: hypothetical protein L6W00_09145 [Lentisphaeria bacterium]|nr:MAG: hypothetical protein L6W00_09145 [Lentisphaeria bacterium]